MMDDMQTGDDEVSPEDAKLDALVTKLAQSYHRPPDFVPANEMWTKIAATRDVAHPTRRHTAVWVLAASAAFLAIGIGIGRGWRPATGASTRTAPTVATTPPETIHTPSAPVQQSADIGAVPDASANTGTPDVVGRRLAVSASGRTPDAARAATRRTLSDVGNSTTYQVATVRHFTEVEALLTSFQSDRRDAKTDQQLATWGRSLLGQTRLLLDSPAANDPVRRKLLQDLELVLVQITQLSPSTAPLERDMIDGAVRTSDVIPRLRTAVPAGGATHFNGA